MPSLASRAVFTVGVTNFDTSPPNRAISLTSLEAIASKLVKEIARLGGDVSKFVTPTVKAALDAKLGK